MTRQRKDWAFWLVTAVIVSGVGILVVLAVKNPTRLDAIGVVSGAVLPTVWFLYSQIQKRSLRFFLFTNRVRSLFSKRALAWNLSANLSGEHVTADVLDKVIEKLLGFRTGTITVKVRRVGEYDAIVVISPGPTVEIAYTPPSLSFGDEMGEQDLPYVQLSIRNYRVGFRQASHAIRREIGPVLEASTSVIQDVDTKYSLVIEFDKERNPFFGLYVAHLPRDVVSKFFIRIAAKNYGPRDTILVSDSKITINTRTQNALQNLALEFLAFHSDVQEQLESA